MPPLPITLVTQKDMASSKSRRYHWFHRPILMSNGVERVAYVAYTIEDGSNTSRSLDESGHTLKDPLTGDHDSTISPSPLTTASIAGTPSQTHRKRKSTAFNPAFLAQDDYVTLRPKTHTIIDRCFPSSSRTSPTANTPAPAPAAGNKKKGPTVEEATEAITINRWSRATDLGNNRSNIPSPREVARAKVKEQERAKARVEAAAQKRTKRNRRRGSNGTTTRNQSPQDKEEVTPAAASNDAVASTSRSEAATADVATFSTNPFPPRVGLKRTRSVGMAPISSSLANSLGASAGAPAVSSPLKAVTGPNTPEEGEQPRKRSRLSDPTEENSPRADTEARKATSLSPPSTSTPLPLDPTPNTVPSATLPLKLEGTEMRRAASSSNIGAPFTRAARRSSFGVEALAARERSKREVTMPGRLRDYDVRASTPAW